ncbi:MAG: hypothetical protein VX830_08745 [Candidatus Poribacteria bacterium]|nr:hypothetical protein [Candidatus Poribacteria bacterium]
MRGKYTFTVSSLKVADDLWGLEFLSLGGPIPSDVVQFDDLVEPLADKPVFFQDVDPISYFRRLTQDVPTFLHGYHARVLNQIRSRLASLEVGSCLHVKVSYLNSSAGINAYNYEIVLAKQIENQKLPGVAPTSIVESPQIIPTVSTEKEISVPADSIDQIQDSQALQQVAQLRLEMNSLHAELHRLKKQIREMENKQQLPVSKSDWSTYSLPFRSQKSTNPDTVNQKIIVKNEKLNPNDDNLVRLSPNENEALSLVMDRGLVTESQLRGLFDNPVAVMESLISKMIDTNTHWIHSERNENGEWIYVWQNQ